jgi:plastocyanin
VRHLASILAAAAFATGITVITAGHGSANPQTSVPTSPPASPAAPASESASATPAAVDAKDFAFAPPTVTIAAGTKVTFVNSDPVAHTVTAADKSFDSGNMDQNATWSHVFDKAGTYAYVCSYHPYMKGTIVVK